MKCLVRVTSTIAILLAIASPTLAQVQTGSILVRVADEQGAAVPGVTITLTSSALVSGTTTGVSDTGGVYRFPSLPPGTYNVKVDLQGFQTVVRESVTVIVGQTVPIDLDDAGGDARRNGDRDRHVAGGRHHERQRRRQPERTAAAGHAGRAGHLGPGRIQSAEPAHHAP